MCNLALYNFALGLVHFSIRLDILLFQIQDFRLRGFLFYGVDQGWGVGLIADGSRVPWRCRSTVHCSNLIVYRWTHASVFWWLRPSCISWVAAAAAADNRRNDGLLQHVQTLTADYQQRRQGSSYYRRPWFEMTALELHQAAHWPTAAQNQTTWPEFCLGYVGAVPNQFTVSSVIS